MWAVSGTSAEAGSLWGEPAAIRNQQKRRHDASQAAGRDAHYILGPFGPDTDLRRYGLRLCERGGKNAKKRRRAVARKLAVFCTAYWVSGEVYEPLRGHVSEDSAGGRSWSEQNQETRNREE